MTRILMIGALLLCACGQQAGQSGQAEAPPAPGTAAAVSDELPDYPGSTRVDVPYLGAGPDRRSGHAIAMETADTPEQIAQFYRAHFAAQNIPVRVDTANAQGGLMSAARDGGRGVMLTISIRDGRTRIGVVRGR